MPAGSRKRAWGSAWHSELVEQSVRRSALRKISGEIDFAFRAPTALEAATSHSDQGDDQADAASDLYDGGTQATGVAARRHPDTIAGTHRKRMFLRLMQDQQDGKADHIVWDVNDLRQQVQHLGNCRRALRTRLHYQSIATNDKLLRVTDTYFAVFRSGFRVKSAPTSSKPVDQVAFLRSVMSECLVTCSTLAGINALIEQWKRYAIFFRLYSYEKRSMVATALDDRPIVQVLCTYKVRVTRQTIAELFPHIQRDAFFVQRLVGQELHCDSRVTFSFDQDGKIDRYDDDSDFIGAFSRVLRDPRDLARLMDGALIAEQSLLGNLELPCS